MAIGKIHKNYPEIMKSVHIQTIFNEESKNNNKKIIA